MDGNDSLAARKEQEHPEIWPGSGIRVPGWNPNGVLGGVVDLHPPVSGLELFMSAKELADAGIPPAEAPAAEGSSGPVDRYGRPAGGDRLAGIEMAAASKPMANGPISSGADTSELQDAIVRSEGTDDATAKAHGYKSGYDVAYGYRKTPKPFSEMNRDEARQQQLEMGRNKNALGRYQFMRATLDDLGNRMHLDPAARFSPDLQERMARQLLVDAGLSKFEVGKIGSEQFQRGLATRWDSLPMPDTGLTHSGKTPHIPNTEFQAILSRMRPK